MCFDVGQKVIVNCMDEAYLDDRGIKNGDLGIVTRIADTVDYPIRVEVVGTTDSVNCSFNPDERYLKKFFLYFEWRLFS